MRATLGAIRVTLLTLMGVVLLGLVSTAASVAAAAARTSVLIMGGSGDPLTTDQDGIPFIRDYVNKAVTNFVSPSSAHAGTGIPGGPYNAVAVITPEQFNTGDPSDHSMTFDDSVAAGTKDLDTCIDASAQCGFNEDIGSDAPRDGDVFVVFGFSQSSTIASFEKAALAEKYPAGRGPDVSFILTANGNRPNGGYLARGPLGLSIPLGLPGGGLTFSGPTRTDTQYSTVDVAIQYDGWADQPINPLNLLAVANANAGQQLLHPHYADQSLNQPGVIDQGQYGDTRYYLVATDTLPLLHQLSQAPGFGPVLADMLDAPLRVIVESGYDRTKSPGVPTSWSFLPAKNPLKTAVDFAVAIPTGWDNAAEDLTGNRPFGTQRPGPYGVGGPDVTYLSPPAETSEATAPARLVSRQTPTAKAARDTELAAPSTDTQTVPSRERDLKSPLRALAEEVKADLSGKLAPKLSTLKKDSSHAGADSVSPRVKVTAPAGALPDVQKKTKDLRASDTRASSADTDRESRTESKPGPKHSLRASGSSGQHSTGDKGDRQSKKVGAHRAAASGSKR